MLHISLSSVWTLVGWLVNSSDLLATAFPALGLTMHNSTAGLLLLFYFPLRVVEIQLMLSGQVLYDWATSPAQQLHFKSCSNWFYRLSRPFCQHSRPFPNLQASNLLRGITQVFFRTCSCTKVSHSLYFFLPCCCLAFQAFCYEDVWWFFSAAAEACG